MTTTSRKNSRLAHSSTPPPTGATPNAAARSRAESVADAYAAQQRAEQQCRERWQVRSQRLQAANDAVDDYMHVSGTTNYREAFNHILRTRPELFAAVPAPAHPVEAGNFNSYHDQLGRFTTSDGGGGMSPDHHHPLPTFGVTGVNRHRQHGERPAQRQGTDAADRKQVAARGVDSIAAHVYDSHRFAFCVAASIQTMIAATTGQGASGLEIILGELMNTAATIPKNAEGKVVSVDSSSGITASGAQYAELLQKVLAQNGVEATVQ